MKDKLGMRIGESVFCIGYLLFAFISSIIFLLNGSHIFIIYGIMTLILALGDSFHLVPRVIKNIKGKSKKIEFWMNLGLIITSITMTIFYILLFYIWKILYEKEVLLIITIIIWITTISRIIICLFPQNKWFTGGIKNFLQ